MHYRWMNGWEFSAGSFAVVYLERKARNRDMEVGKIQNKNRGE